MSSPLPSLSFLNLAADHAQQQRAAAQHAAQIPAEIGLAAAILFHHQDLSMPHLCGHGRTMRVMRRDAGPDELRALVTACSLLADFFDRHNQRLTAQRTATVADAPSAG